MRRRLARKLLSEVYLVALLRVAPIGVAASAAAALAAAAPAATPFRAPIANPFEARVGTLWQIDEKKLRLDIGASADVLEPIERDSSGWMRIGADFMTWTRLRSEGNLKFPVETIDYWFGVHATYAFFESPWHLRLRIAHISSHMVDGLADSDGTISPKPFVYSREFVELLAGYYIGRVRPYAGATFIWTRLPKNPNPIIPQAGIDLDMPIADGYQLQGGYDFKLIGIDGVYAPAHAAQVGVKAVLWNDTGLYTGIYAYSGRSMHGMFYTAFDQYIGLGLQFIW